MANLKQIQARGKVLETPLIIDLTEIPGGKKVEYILSGATIEKYKEEEAIENKKYLDDLKKELNKSGVSIQNLNINEIAIKYINKVGEDVANKKALAKIFKVAENYVFSFDVGVTKEEVKEWFSEEFPNTGDVLYVSFINECYGEFLAKLKVNSGK